MPPPYLIPFRDEAKQHVDAAKALLKGEGASLRYACLELRLAIEALAYDVLQSYSEDIADAVDQAHGDWQPSRVLEHLLAYDPMAEADLVVVMRMSVAGADPVETVITGAETRFTAKWAGKAHRAMSSFLHQRTIAQLQRGKAIDTATLRRKARAVMSELDAILACEVHDVRLGFRFGYDCPDCGGDISIALLPLMQMGAAKTRCGSCGVTWRASGGGETKTPVFTRMVAG